MVKTSHKKFVKKERNKVKLKGKKLLPKGQNVTDTSFKVKKIVVKEQLKEHDPSELLSRRKLNIKELVSRMNHHNAGMRQEALVGLKEVVELYSTDTIKRHLPELLEAAANLTIDREKTVRADALKLLSAVLEQVSVEELIPLFPILCSYLVCAMTHIEIAIREDSLKLLDTLLRVSPELVASQPDALLPRFIDLISEKSGNGRTLSLHLEGKISAEKWRAQVLYRLQKLLAAIKNHIIKTDISSNKELNQTELKIYNWEKNTPLFIPLYNNIYFQPMTVSFGKMEAPVQINDSKLKIQEYAEVLIPLLLATFMEVAPYKNKDDTSNQHQISIEAAVLLQCIVDIILTLWKLVQLCDNSKSALLWFRHTYTDSICKRLVDVRFPYSTSQLESKIVNKKWKKEVKALLSAVDGTQTIDGHCLMQNLGIAQLVLLLTDSNDKIRLIVVNYLKNCLRNCSTLDEDKCVLLRNCLEAVCTNSKESDSRSILKSVSAIWKQHKTLDRPVSVMVFDFLTEITLNRKYRNLYTDENLEAWLATLPELLTLPKISFSTIKQISRISTHGIAAFSNSLDGWIETILDNIAVVNIEGCTIEEEKTARRDMISLLYWVKDWDDEMICNLQKAISSRFFGDLTSHLVDILKLKAERDSASVLSKLINESLQA